MIKKAYKEIGLKKTTKYIISTLILIIFKLMVFSPLRIVFLRVMGVKIGNNCVIHSIRFFNLYRGSFSNLVIGDNCFIGDETMLDMADKIVLEDWVTLAERVIILTHMNVGFREHPLQRYFPSFTKPVTIKEGGFIGCNSTIIAGVTIEKMSLVAAGSVITKNMPHESVIGGVPAKIIRKIK